MGDSFRTCRDGHRCENESRCLEDPNDEGSFFCDCSVANGDFAGLYCEYEAEEYCKFPQEVSETWFCSNGGTCVVDVNQNGAKFTCDCQEDFYEGPHCEFVKGALPDDWPSANGVSGLGAAQPGKQKDELKTGVKAVIVLVSLIIVGLLALVIIQKRRSRDDQMISRNSIKDPSQALQLEADGHAFQHAVKSSASTPQSDDYDFESPDSGLAVEVERPKTPTNQFSSNGGGGGHGRII